MTKKGKNSSSIINYQLPLFGFLVVSVAMTTLLVIQGTSFDLRNRAADPSLVHATPTAIPGLATNPESPSTIPLQKISPTKSLAYFPKVFPTSPTVVTSVVPTFRIPTHTPYPTVQIVSTTPEVNITPSSDNILTTVQNKMAALFGAATPIPTPTQSFDPTLPVEFVPKKKDLFDYLGELFAAIIAPTPKKKSQESSFHNPIPELWNEFDEKVVNYLLQKFPTPTPYPTIPPQE